MFFVSEAISQGFKSDFVLVKTAYTFPGNASICATAEWSKSSPTEAIIATCQNQIFWIEKGFQKEFKWKEKHLLLNSAKFTDRGRYEIVCNGVKYSLKLDVLCKYALYLIPIKLESICEQHQHMISD